MTNDDEVIKKLEYINNLDPYWQKWEWWNLKLEKPEFYQKLKEYNDRPK